MEYILNETPLKTTNGFKINNIKVDLDIPEKLEFHDYKVLNSENITIDESVKKKFKSSIGLENEVYKNVEINVPDNFNSDLPLFINYDFIKNDALIDNIIISLKNSSNINIIIKYISKDDSYHFHNGKLLVNAENGSRVNVTILNKFNNISKNLYEIEVNAKSNSKVICNLIDLEGNTRIYSAKSNTYEESESYLNNIYIGKDNELIDMNYNYLNIGEKSINNIEVQGLLNDKAIKHFKGTIDFKEGSRESVGKENENCVLLTKDAISRSLPMLLCHEENVEGAHSVSSGTIDKSKLFYLMSRGFSEKEAKRIIIKSNFNEIINNTPDDIHDEINALIDLYL